MARRDAIAGTGLGLASCRLLADIMGGSVGVTSEPGCGARFFLRLPLSVVAVEMPPPGETLPPATVLVVEDTDYNAMAAAAVLARLGLTSTRVRTGHEALTLFREKRFNVVLLDRNLPDLDGTEVARRIRTMETGGPRALLLAVTAYCTAADRDVCLAAGMDAFVGKPLTPEKLRRVLLAAGRRLLTAASVQLPVHGAEPGVDLTLLEYISDGTDAGLGLQVERFVAALDEAEVKLARAARAADYATLAEGAHFVLSQAKLVGDAALEEAALQLERAAREREGTARGELWLAVRRAISALKGALSDRDPGNQPA